MHPLTQIQMSLFIRHSVVDDKEQRTISKGESLSTQAKAVELSSVLRGLSSVSNFQHCSAVRPRLLQ